MADPDNLDSMGQQSLADLTRLLTMLSKLINLRWLRCTEVQSSSAWKPEAFAGKALQEFLRLHALTDSLVATTINRPRGDEAVSTLRVVNMPAAHPIPPTPPSECENSAAQ
eukprot:TRINITY_DN58846_c0_g1_i1.p1 TRINITY_DN58846_c0_g1~~TRINITY_DN58846_c0_g1_i1.p1  ORF type:complete len:111 (-),score=14.13 TRINITY_DN58846_c0_g1_i1:82-414(-)